MYEISLKFRASEKPFPSCCCVLKSKDKSNVLTQVIIISSSQIRVKSVRTSGNHQLFQTANL